MNKSVEYYTYQVVYVDIKISKNNDFKMRF